MLCKELATTVSVELEEVLLKTVIVYPDLFGQAKDLIVDSSVFYTKSYRTIWEELCGICAEKTSEEYDSLEIEQLVLHKVRGHASSEFIFYNDVLNNLMDNCNTAPTSLAEVCRQLNDVFYKRKVLQLLELSMDSLTENKDLDNLLEQLEAGIYEIQQQRSGAIRDYRVQSGCTAEQDHGSFREFLAAPIEGLKSGLIDFDKITLGIQPGTVSVIAGRPGMGKTAFAAYLANSYSLQGEPVIFFSLEMQPLDMDLRRVSLLTKIDNNKFTEKTLSAAEVETSVQMFDWMKTTPFYYDGNPRATVQSIRSTLRHYVSIHGHVGAFFVDYLQLMDGDGSGTRNNEIEKISRQLRALAVEFKTRYFCLSQLNRGVESRADKRPLISDLKDCGAIEQDADYIVFLYRDEYYNQDSLDRGVSELILSKHRRYTTGKAKVLTQLQFSNYENLAQNSYY
jgi:replicative DNA helicase